MVVSLSRARRAGEDGMPSEGVQKSEVRQAEPMPGPSPREEAEEYLESLVEKGRQWLAEAYFFHGQLPETGSPDSLRGFMRWLRRDRARGASVGPRPYKWPSTSFTHQQGACWCGFLPSVKEEGMAE
jgi:hypothetical protein